MSAQVTGGAKDKEQSFVTHLLELRDRLLKMVLAIVAMFVLLFPFSEQIYTTVAQPLMAHLPAGSTMIATEVASPFLTPFKLTLVAAVFIAVPFILYQFWAFVAPGLYQHEKRLAVPLLVSSILLFYLGVLFAYFVVFPLVFQFLIGIAPEGVSVMTDIARYLDFVLTLFFAFGVAFEIPIATIVLIWMGATTAESLRKKRPYIIVGAFVLGMLLTPPDIISQTLLALPMWLLFEAGILFSSWFVKPREKEAAESNTLVDEVAVAAAAAPSSAAYAGDNPTTRPEDGPRDSIIEIEDEQPFQPLTDEEMEAELDRIEAEEAEVDGSDESQSGAGPETEPETEEEAMRRRVDAKLEQVMALRNVEDYAGARRLLYEVLEDGDESQIRVARNILEQLDT